MRLFASSSRFLMLSLMLSGCVHKGTNPVDPYEPINRKIHKVNMTIDRFALKPAAKVYKTVIPGFIRKGINNAYSNVLMLPTTANDLLQGDWRHGIKDTWRFLINSTLGVGGLFDLADKSFALPPHYNDLGLTFAKWGDKNSPYIVIPFFGPSTIRDGMSMPFDYLLTPYPYLPSSVAFISINALRYVDLRAQLLESERLMNEALDQYAFIRDAYLQHRNFLINGEQNTEEGNSLYVDEGKEKDEGSDYIEDEKSASVKVEEPAKAGIPPLS